jgi:uncharacterized protein (DUF1499 family)
MNGPKSSFKATAQNLIILGLAGGLLACSSGSVNDKPQGALDERMAPCPSSPNCVSSRDSETPPWNLTETASAAWPQIIETVNGLARTKIVTEDGYYLHAESTSKLFGFVDDLELAIDQQRGSLEFRSASRLGYSDLGVNQQRITRLYDELRKRQLVR